MFGAMQGCNDYLLAKACGIFKSSHQPLFISATKSSIPYSMANKHCTTRIAVRWIVQLRSRKALKALNMWTLYRSNQEMSGVKGQVLQDKVS